MDDRKDARGLECINYLKDLIEKGNAMDCGNYKGISLLCTTYKILSNIILNRLRPYAVYIKGDYQSGFLVGRSTIIHDRN